MFKFLASKAEVEAVTFIGVTDLVEQVCQLLGQDLRELQELVDTMEPVESWDEG